MGLISICLQERDRLSNHFNKCITSSPVAIPGRLIQPTQKQSWGGDHQTLAEQDTQRVYQLLQKYRQLVDTGELCAGDCPNDGVSCSSGVCRAHLRYALWYPCTVWTGKLNVAKLYPKNVWKWQLDFESLIRSFLGPLKVLLRSFKVLWVLLRSF